MHFDIAKVKHNPPYVGGTSEGQRGGLWPFHTGQPAAGLGAFSAEPAREGRGS